MSSFKNSGASSVVYNVINTIIDNWVYLSEVDGLIGDGDHGVNMNKGFTMTKNRLGGKEVSLSEGFNVLGKTLILEIGGSMGPLYGTFFTEFAKACKEVEDIDKESFGATLQGALKGMQAFDKAKVGDKTLMDTLAPALEAYKAALAEGKDFKTALEDMKVAAEKGKESTKDMVAKIGRAARLGERSRGVLDAGATSCNLILQSMADAIIALI
jgi:phosphoenolpyruvate---glycerone phosphotransferase subunit DhaL